MLDRFSHLGFVFFENVNVDIRGDFGVAMTEDKAEELIAKDKEDDAKVSLRMQGTGPIGLLIVDANTKGEVRGYVKNPYVMLPLKENGHLDVGRAIGRGMITVIKDIGIKEYLIKKLLKE